MPKGNRHKPPKAGDRQIREKFLGRESEEVTRLGKLKAEQGFTDGPAGSYIPAQDVPAGGVFVHLYQTSINYIPFPAYGNFGGRSYGADLTTGMEANTAAHAAGNYLPTSDTESFYNNRFGFWCWGDVVQFDGRRFYATGERVKIVNPSSAQLPYNGLFFASQISDEFFGIVTPVGYVPPSFYAEAYPYAGQAVGNKQCKFARGWFGGTDNIYIQRMNFAHAELGDVFIHQPGFFKITFGANFTANISASGNDLGTPEASTNLFIGQTRTADITFTGSPNPTDTPHAHDVYAPAPAAMRLHLVKDYDGSITRPITSDNVLNLEVLETLTIPIFNPGYSAYIRGDGERTITAAFNYNHPKNAGGCFTRLSLVYEAWIPNRMDSLRYEPPTYNPYPIYFTPQKLWMRIEPTGAGYGDTGRFGPMGLNFKRGPESGSVYGPAAGDTNAPYQWWGGGAVPIEYDSNGAPL